MQLKYNSLTIIRNLSVMIAITQIVELKDEKVIYKLQPLLKQREILYIINMHGDDT